METSPADERAWQSAQTSAKQSDKLGLEPEIIRESLRSHSGRSPVSPVLRELIQLASEHSLVLRGEPSPTSEFVFLAALSWDADYENLLSSLGLNPDRIVEALKMHSPPPTEESVQPGFTVSDPIEVTSAARIIDVNLNRARESFRVLDDYCRFVLEDRFLTQSFKDLRHRLVTASKRLENLELIAARETQSDVGTNVEGHGEYTRHTPYDVAITNIKRLQEALRSLEEFGKIVSPLFARDVEAIRYETYTLERAVTIGTHARDRLAFAKLYLLLTGSQCQHSLDWTIREAAAGGTDIVQLREKALTDRDLLSRARLIRHWTRESGLLFIVNDRPDIARLCDADGVHLGQDDLSVSEARRIVGPDALIGVSTQSQEQLRQAVRDGADYVGIGPVFPSSTKSFDHFPGLDFVRHAAESTTLPAFALGGITPGNAGRIAEAGLLRIAVASAVTASDDPQAACRALRQALSRT
jgi:thiamine-phosphate pyrophosphorylase